MHLHAERAAVDLRGAQVHEVLQPVIQPGGIDRGVDLQQGLVNVGEQLLVADGVVVLHGGVSSDQAGCLRSEEHTSELQSLMRISYAVFCLKKKKCNNITNQLPTHTTYASHSYQRHITK